MTPPENWYFNFGYHLHSFLKEFEQANAPELVSDLTSSGVLGVDGRYDDEVAIIEWKINGPGFVMGFGTLKEETFNKIKSLAGSERDFSELRRIDGLSDFYSPKSMILISDIIDDEINFEHFENQASDWYNLLCMPNAEKLNQARISRVIPVPPRWEVDSISRNCWVIESELGISQGTTFPLAGVGWITCAHVVSDGHGNVHPDLAVYHPSEPNNRHRPEIVRINGAVDVAVMEIPALNISLERYAGPDIALHEHIAVCGYPNFTSGSGCFVSPGIVVAHKMQSGVRRIITNAGIVAGMSGGPAIVGDNHVAGICANGAPYRSDLVETDDQSIIPIQVLDILLDSR